MSFLAFCRCIRYQPSQHVITSDIFSNMLTRRPQVDSKTSHALSISLVFNITSERSLLLTLSEMNSFLLREKRFMCEITYDNLTVCIGFPWGFIRTLNGSAKGKAKPLRCREIGKRKKLNLPSHLPSHSPCKVPFDISKSFFSWTSRIALSALCKSHSHAN